MASFHTCWADLVVHLLAYLLVIIRTESEPVHMSSLCGLSDPLSEPDEGLKSIEKSGRKSWRARTGERSVEMSDRSWFSWRFSKSTSPSSESHFGAETIRAREIFSFGLSFITLHVSSKLLNISWLFVRGLHCDQTSKENRQNNLKILAQNWSNIKRILN